MSVKIRLRRMGAHKRPFYRIVVADSRSPRDGRFIEELGYYNPLTDPATVKIDGDKARKWLSTGAQPTDTVRALLKKAGISKPTKQDLVESAASDEVQADPAQVNEDAGVSADNEEPTSNSAEAADSEGLGPDVAAADDAKEEA
ncbi:hypothetical protein FACS1894127_4660 [Clostridia bacterium]|nr:hypothetical protein FACS1894127_4660 [Clostridia bacterium]